MLTHGGCIIIMSTKLKFKIISCSSEQNQHPVSGLLFGGSEGWQSRRFCTYPQQITLEFYGVVNIRKIEFVSDHRKISSQVDILYYVPSPNQQQRFYKYGYLQFNRNEQGNARQVKTIMVDINCIYIRFLFHKPYQARDNFFSQIGLHALSIFGAEGNANFQVEAAQAQTDDREYQTNEQDQQYISQIVAKLSQSKDTAIQNEDYQSANYYKNTIKVIYDLASKLRQNRIKIQKAIEQQNYDEAKRIKAQIEQQKREINEILQGGQEPVPQLEEDNQFAQISKEEQGGNQFMEPASNSVTNSRAKAANSRVSSRLAQSRPNKYPQTKYPTLASQNYDQRVIPTLQSNKQKTQTDQFGQQRQKELPPVEQVQGKYIKQATIMQEYFGQETVMKFFSQYWQYNLEALASIQAESKQKQKDSNFMRCLINAVKFSITQINFQVGLLSLSLLQDVLKMNADSQIISKPGDMQNDLQQIGREVVKKLTDNNPKIKAAAQQTFAVMTSSLMYGVQACSIALTKSKSKLSSKQLSIRLQLITKMIDQYGLASGTLSVPITALDFAIQQLNNASDDVRKQAIGLLSSAYRQDKQKTQQKIGGLRQNVVEQIRGQARVQPKQKSKKH